MGDFICKLYFWLTLNSGVSLCSFSIVLNIPKHWHCKNVQQYQDHGEYVWLFTDCVLDYDCVKCNTRFYLHHDRGISKVYEDKNVKRFQILFCVF